MERITWECFLREINIIYDLSQRLNDNWQIITSVRVFSSDKLIYFRFFFNFLTELLPI